MWNETNDKKTTMTIAKTVVASTKHIHIYIIQSFIFFSIWCFNFWRSQQHSMSQTFCMNLYYFVYMTNGNLSFFPRTKSLWHFRKFNWNDFDFNNNIESDLIFIEQQSKCALSVHLSLVHPPSPFTYSPHSRSIFI